ncbi:TPA: hypothetical protein ACGCCP_000574 [Acinetobacter nosocomialis]
MDKCREEFEKKLKCQDLLSELTFCEKTSSYEGDILPTNLATINGAYWAWVKRQAEMDEQQAKVEELQKRVGAALKKLDKRRDELWSKWKGQADMQDQGAANAFEEAYWILEQALKGGGQ